MPLKPEARAIVDIAAKEFPALGTEVVDADHARRILARRPQPDVEPIPVGWVAERTVPGSEGCGDVRARVYWPGKHIDRPGVVVFCHGGGWVLCDVDTHDRLCRAMTNATGAVVVSVDYRRAPEHPFPAAAVDAYTVTRWVADHPTALGADPDRIAVAGDSSGGNLAAVTALMARDRGGPDIAFQLLIYPMLDHAQDTASYRDNAHGYFVTADHLRWYWQQYLGDSGDGAHPYASPLRAADLSGLPPAHIITAELDPLRDEAEEYGRRLAAAGTPTDVRRYDGMFHGFVSMAEHLPDAVAAGSAAYRALAAALGTSPEHPDGEAGP
ncbi:alpha/beta hydrolase [Haloechinothrix sp. YIM 98757]|uniref:Alpha/beta hydrolase n=1 Tax=Haloechinothrix aidingensis TaxID=2752311 RepID=A0A838ABD1_9PSEU|nr:alpha/beta hydrolase [Haloechinothrix aidingensis]MBA0126562.1 alpha/beta hydrolase [Haloechinothrix aidingensis]